MDHTHSLASANLSTDDWSLGEGLGITGVAVFAGLLAGDWIAGAAVAVLWIVWKYMRDGEGLPVLAMALTFQWFQVTVGIWYCLASDRQLDAMAFSEYRPMVLAGLGCVMSFVIGLRIGIKLIDRYLGRPDHHDVELGVRWVSL